MQKIKVGDLVQVISGNEKGARGEVKEVIRGWRVGRFKAGRTRNPNADRVVITGVNIRKKHQRPVSQTRTQTGIIEMEAPIHISNVMLVCPTCKEAVRVGFGFEGDKKVRVCKRCGANID
ncbi:MAG: 50S ribosomal protein L24 [Chloroflexi bacterium]|nr:MAG: 50S ribosomal protein L24 [Chloroflexota bacterium]